MAIVLKRVARVVVHVVQANHIVFCLQIIRGEEFVRNWVKKFFVLNVFNVFKWRGRGGSLQFSFTFVLWKNPTKNESALRNIGKQVRTLFVVVNEARQQTRARSNIQSTNYARLFPFEARINRKDENSRKYTRNSYFKGFFVKYAKLNTIVRYFHRNHV